VKYLDFERIKKIDELIQKWIRDNKRQIATPDMVIVKLVEEGFYSDNQTALEQFTEEIRKMTKKEQREYLNIHHIGVKEFRFKNRDNF